MRPGLLEALAAFAVIAVLFALLIGAVILGHPGLTP